MLKQYPLLALLLLNIIISPHIQSLGQTPVPAATATVPTPLPAVTPESAAHVTTAPTYTATDCQYKELEMLGNASGLLPRDKDSLDEDITRFSQMINACDNISKTTCCTSDMFQKISKSWGAVYRNTKTNPLSQILYGLTSLFETNYAAITTYAGEMLPTLRKRKEQGILASNDAAAQKQIDSFVKVYQQKYSSNRFNKNWKVYAKKCYRYMLKVAKGSFCAICDIEEHSRFSNSNVYAQPATTAQTAAQRLLQAVQNKQPDIPNTTTNAYLSSADAFAFSNNCADYIEEHVYLLEHLKLFQTVLIKKST